MTFDDITRMMGSLNIYLIYGTAAALTVVLTLYRIGVLQVPRWVALLCLYSIILMALLWLAFWVSYSAAHDPRDSGLATLARVLSFLPVYGCAQISAFVYPKKRSPI